MASFDLYAPKLKRWEGGFVNDPVDPGGATNMGITLSTYRLYFGNGKTVDDLKHISGAEWRYIMKKYWDKCKGDLIENQSIAEMFVDWYINAGVSAIRKTQTYFDHLKVDGIVGKGTLAVLNGTDRQMVFNRIKSARISYYNKLAMTKPALSKFLRGWLNRTNSFTYSAT